MKELISIIESFDNAHILALAAFIPGSREKVIDLLSSASADDLHAAESILAQMAEMNPNSDNKAALALVRGIV